MYKDIYLLRIDHSRIYLSQYKYFAIRIVLTLVQSYALLSILGYIGLLVNTNDKMWQYWTSLFFETKDQNKLNKIVCLKAIIGLSGMQSKLSNIQPLT